MNTNAPHKEKAASGVGAPNTAEIKTIIGIISYQKGKVKMKESTKKCIVAAFAASITTAILSSCNSLPELPANGFVDNPSMTQLESTSKYTIYIHNPTGVHYIAYKGGEGNSAFTAMLNSDGTPYTGS